MSGKKDRLNAKPQQMTRQSVMKSDSLTWEQMNRQQRRAYKSSKKSRYMGLVRPTDNGRLNASRKTGGIK